MNGDGELELFEWLELAAIVFLGKDDEEVPTEMFAHLSDSETGKITKASLFAAASRLLSRVGQNDFTPLHAEAMLKVVDATGEVDREQFVSMCAELGVYVRKE